MKNIILSSLLCLCLSAATVNAQDALQTFARLNHAGLLVLDSDGQVSVSEHAGQGFIPASTTKLVTAWLALQHWGEQHRFHTDFYLDPATQTLWVEGFGDPFLVAEELQRIALQLKQHGLQKINSIALDSSYFADGVVLPGTGQTSNPYDAVPSALAANFNTIHVKKVQGKVLSAEQQTPLTAYAIHRAQGFSKASIRVNTGTSIRDTEFYFAELLAAFLRLQGVQVGEKVSYGKVPELSLYYRHMNSRTLAQVIQPMLKYSTNFIANQLILKLSAEHFQRPANAADVQNYMQGSLKDAFHWQDFILQDGAGLSRANRLSPQQLVELVLAFDKWKHLLPKVEAGVFAKTGTLENVSTLAGYLVTEMGWCPFALMMNQAVPFKLRNQVATQLLGLSH